MWDLTVQSGRLTFIAELPKGYDDRCKITEFGDYIIVAHPDHKPLKITKDGKVKEMEIKPDNERIQ